MPHFAIVIETSTTGYSAFSPDVLGCVATGSSVEATLAEMRSALIYHFEGMLEAGETLPEPKGLEHYTQSGDFLPDPGDLLTSFPAEELLAEMAATSTQS